MIIPVQIGIADKGYYLCYVGLIGYCAEGALIHARAAGNALFLVYNGLLGVLVNMYGLRLAGIYAGARVLNYCRIRANSHALAALYAFFFVYNSLVVNYAYGILGAVILAAVRKAGGGYLNTVNGAFVARNGQHAYYRAVFIPAKGHAYALVYNGALFIYAAAEHGLAFRNYSRGNFHYSLRGQLIAVGKLCNLPKHVVLHFLYMGIE